MVKFYPKDRPMQSKLLSKIKVSTTTGCWNWVAGKIRQGYGMVRHNSEQRRSHRVSYEVFNGEIPEGLSVLHSCDNPSCINPGHLSVGTPLDNSQDMVIKGRSLKGSKHPLSKLTEENVKVIKAMLRNTDKTCREISVVFGVSRGAIKSISSGYNWKHIK